VDRVGDPRVGLTQTRFIAALLIVTTHVFACSESRALRIAVFVDNATDSTYVLQIRSDSQTRLFEIPPGGKGRLPGLSPDASALLVLDAHVGSSV